jgi:hypothetical protein
MVMATKPVEGHPKVKTIFISGRLSIEDGNYLEASIMEAIKARCSHLFLILLDLAGVDEDVLQGLSRWKEFLHIYEMKLDLIVPQQGTRKLLETSSIIGGIPIYPSIVQALASHSLPLR